MRTADELLQGIELLLLPLRNGLRSLDLFLLSQDMFLLLRRERLRSRELLERANGSIDARTLVREVKAVGGDLRTLRRALTGQDRGPELWTVIAALPPDETLRRIDAAL